MTIRFYRFLMRLPLSNRAAQTPIVEPSKNLDQLKKLLKSYHGVVWPLQMNYEWTAVEEVEMSSGLVWPYFTATVSLSCTVKSVGCNRM